MLLRILIQNKYKLNNLIHYSDDFFLVCIGSWEHAKQQLNTLCQAFHDMGIPLADNKVIGPTLNIIYLGIGINSASLTMYVTDERYEQIKSELKSWKKRRTCKKQELESLIGKLSFIAKVVQPGRLFLRRLIHLTTTVKKSHHHITLNEDSRADIDWWAQFLPEWSQITLIPETYSTLPTDLRLHTDACGYGFGGIYQLSWIQGTFEGEYANHSIDFKELFAIVASVFTWGRNWSGKRIIIHTDNKPITDIWQAGSSPSKDIMCLIRKLYLFAAEFQFSISLKHISGTHNGIADAISRFQTSRLRTLLPQADEQSTSIPREVWALLQSIPIPVHNKNGCNSRKQPKT